MRTESHNVCTGITTSFFVQYLPDDPGKEEFSKVDRGEHSTSALIIVPYRKYPLVGLWEIDYDPKGSGGSNIIWQHKDRETDSTLSVQWSFKPNDPCQKLKEMIEHDLAYAEGYLDRTTRQRPMKNYKCYVDRWVFERMYGFPLLQESWIAKKSLMAMEKSLVEVGEMESGTKLGSIETAISTKNPTVRRPNGIAHLKK